MILLTGGTGFLGRFIVDELLTHGHQVRLLARSPEKVQAREGVEIVEGDLRDQLALERAMDGVTHVIHAAAMVSFWSRKRDEMFEINAKGTALLVDLALEANVEKFVQISSVSALGRRKNSGPIDESAKWIKSKLNTNYGRSKYLAELEVLRGVQEGLNAVMCNPGIIIGPGDWDQGPPKMFKMIHKGLRYYNPGITGFVPAVDVARATRLLMGSEFVNGERFVLVSDSIPYKDF
ncbi:MAG: NAD-dependent epimerase/dehydratase family protein, partial [Bacteroidota bacterium]